jgi:hypothetical protein
MRKNNDLKKIKWKSSPHLELPTLNRSLVILRPKEPYIKWIEQLPPQTDPRLRELALSSLNEDPTVFLIPNDSDPDDAIEHYLPYLWHEVLSAWHTDEAAWPKKLGLKEFKKWFVVETASMIFDLPNRDTLEYEE